LYAGGFNGQVEALEPPELREKVIQQAKAVLERYGKQGD
jgi:predicted DNA-binding transcriptional regulator YafY